MVRRTEGTSSVKAKDHDLHQTADGIVTIYAITVKKPRPTRMTRTKTK